MEKSIIEFAKIPALLTAAAIGTTALSGCSSVAKPGAELSAEANAISNQDGRVVRLAIGTRVALWCIESSGDIRVEVDDAATQLDGNFATVPTDILNPDDIQGQSDEAILTRLPDCTKAS